MRTPLTALIVVSAFSLAAHAQSARFARDGTLIISDGSQRIRIPKVSEPREEAPTAPCVHAILKRHGEYFVVVTTSEWSRGYPPRGGHCGCGEEAYLKWFHVVGGKVSESTNAHYDSCFDNRGGGVDGWSGSILTVTTRDLLEDRVDSKAKDIWQDITYTFDAHHPENGIKEEKGKPHE